jgi:hypothetical protein
MARTDYKLRHAPLWIAVAMCRASDEHRLLVADTLVNIIQRPDELAEFMALYWKNGKVPVAAQVKKGLARAFAKFDEYSLAKYNRDGAVKLRDVLFLSHAKPDTERPLGRATKAKATKHRGETLRHTKGQAGLWKRLIDGELATPDTWEVAISAAKTKVEREQIWDRLIDEKKLFALALIRNIRNMVQDGVKPATIKAAIRDMRVERVLPFRFITAAQYNPHYEDVLEEAMFKCLAGMEKLSGTTALVVDVSGSMWHSTVSAKSELKYFDAAAGLAILCRELCEDVKVFTFSDNVVAIPNRRGFALRDAMDKSQRHNGTYLAKALQEINFKHEFDRCIVITDEQSQDGIFTPRSKKNYLINVAANKNGVGYGEWMHLDGFSEAVFNWICAVEKPQPEVKAKAWTPKPKKVFKVKQEAKRPVKTRKLVSRPRKAKR